MIAAITHLEAALDVAKNNRQVALNEGDEQKARDYDVDILDIEASLEVLNNSEDIVSQLVDITRKMNRSFQLHVGYAAIIAAFTTVGVVHVAKELIALIIQ